VGSDGAEVFFQVVLEGVEVGLVDEVGLAAAGELHGTEEAGDVHAGFGDADVVIVGEDAVGGVDLVGEAAVVVAQAADPVAQPGLGAGDVGQQAVGLPAAAELGADRFEERLEGVGDVAAPHRLAAGCRGDQGGADLVDGFDDAVLVALAGC
jgi:hypothetical protein